MNFPFVNPFIIFTIFYFSSDQENNSFDRPFIWSDKPLTIKLRKATRFLDRDYDIIERYPMRSKPRGLVLIIANIYYYSSEDEPRLSAQHDTNNLQTLFEEMGFKVFVYENLTGKVYISLKTERKFLIKCMFGNNFYIKYIILDISMN